MSSLSTLLPCHLLAEIPIHLVQPTFSDPGMFLTFLLRLWSDFPPPLVGVDKLISLVTFRLISILRHLLNCYQSWPRGLYSVGLFIIHAPDYSLSTLHHRSAAFSITLSNKDAG